MLYIIRSCEQRVRKSRESDYSNFSGEDEVTALAWSPDGYLLASASTDRTVHIWDILTGAPPLAYRGHQDEVWSVAWSPNGKLPRLRLLGGHGAGVGRKDRTDEGDLPGQSASVWAISWSPDGTYLASASKDRTVQAWEAMTGKLLLTYRGHSSEAWDVSWSPDGELIASVGGGSIVQLWHATTGKQIALLHV